ncbi:hypothetical protein CHS0354_027682 [Potamilus streckersoni]|uniref:Lethal(3)malignant brain tumor-like protein 1 n=1 Tax=Potamilus streckersoni TaxID=2493646 RepID=A0AAE0T0U5_9BIVA|nr:hypothetical protein CHS0354_027682 [Potamilus streckersoni]
MSTSDSQGSGEPDSQPPSKKLKIDNTSQDSIAKLVPVTGTATAVTSAVTMTPVSVATTTASGAANIQGGISLTISNGVINLKTSAAGPQSGSVTSTTSPALAVRPTNINSMPSSLTVVKVANNPNTNLMTAIPQGVTQLRIPGSVSLQQIRSPLGASYLSPQTQGANVMSGAVPIKPGMTVPLQNVQVQQKVFSTMQAGQVVNTATIQVAAPGSGICHPRSQQIITQIQTLPKPQLIQSNKITDGGTMTIQFSAPQGTNRSIPIVNKPPAMSESNKNPVGIVNNETKLKAGDQSKVPNVNSQSKLTLSQQTGTKVSDNQLGAVVQERKFTVPVLQMATLSHNTSVSKVDIKSGQIPQQIVAIAQAPVGKVDSSKSVTLSQPIVVSKPETVCQTGSPDSGEVLTSQPTQSLVMNVNTPVTQVITRTVPVNQLSLTKIDSKTAMGTQSMSYKVEAKTVPIAQVVVNKVENGPPVVTQIPDNKNSLSAQSTISSTKTSTSFQLIVSKTDGKSQTTQPSNTLTVAAVEHSEATQPTVYNNSANVKPLIEPSFANFHDAAPVQQGSADSRPKQQEYVVPVAMSVPKKPQWNMVGQLTSTNKKPDKNLQPFKQISNLDQNKAALGKESSLGATAVSQPIPLPSASSFASSTVQNSDKVADKDMSENCETEKTETCCKQSSDTSCETQSEKPVMTSSEQVSNKKESEISDISSSESTKNGTGSVCASEEKETKAENQSTEGTCEEPSQEKNETENEQKPNNKGEEPMDTPTTFVDGADFDPASAMIWENGIGTLQGSNLKFRMNEFGIMEMVTDNLNCTEILDTSNESDNTPVLAPTDSAAEVKVKDESGEVKEDVEEAGPSQDYGSQIKEEEKNEDQISQCENCGEYGFATDFYKNGRFCSQSCVGAFASKRMRGVKKHGVMSKVVLGLQKRKKKFHLKGGEDVEEFKKDGIAGKKSKVFIWSKYLEKENAIGASPKLFKDPFPNNKNGFKVGMKLEGIDHKHQNLYCVVSIAEVCGYRLRLHFDGYSDCYDFWTNADSPFIFPVGFCEKAQKILQPPKGFTVEGFNWSNYLKLAKAVAAPKYAFVTQPSQSVTPSAFRVGSKLEAVDKKNSSLICVATVADTLWDKILIHFDSWEESYDYWCDISSPYIHPAGWCQENGKLLSPPCDWKDVDTFTWDAFLNKSKSTAVPARAFKPRAPIPFESGMKVEVVDKRNTLLIRVASIVDVQDYMVKIHFDGWSDAYDYWLDDDSPDLHPPGWCAKTGHPLAPPILPSDLVVCPGQSGCPTPGCKGVGHIKGAKYTGHHSAFGCPYSQLNMNKENTLQDRLGAFRFDDTAPDLSPTTPKSNKQLDFPASPEVKRCPVQGCDGSGHVTGKFTAHHKISGCPLAAERAFSQKQKGPYTNGDIVPPPPRPKSTRGRKPRSYYLNMGDRMPKPKEKEQKDNNSLHHGIHQSVFQSSFISLPQRDLPLCWEQHTKLLPGVDKIRGNDVANWTIDQVANFVKTLLGSEEQAKAFREEQIDGEAFLLLTQTDIVKIMNIRLGPALKIYNSIMMFKNSLEV